VFIMVPEVFIFIMFHVPDDLISFLENEVSVTLKNVMAILFLMVKVPTLLFFLVVPHILYVPLILFVLVVLVLVILLLVLPTKVLVIGYVTLLSLRINFQEAKV
jgi:hypothetical protein